MDLDQLCSCVAVDDRRHRRDLLRPVFLTRSGGMQMEAGELSEAEVELEVVEPWDTRVNMFGA